MAKETCLDSKEFNDFVTELRERLRKRPGDFLVWLKIFDTEIKNLNSWILKIKKISLDKGELIRLYTEFDKRMKILWRWGYLPFVVDEAVYKELELILDKKMQLNKGDVIEAVSFSGKFTLHQQYEMATLALADMARKKGLNSCGKRIDKHLKKWGWINSWLYRQIPLERREFEKNLLKLSGEKPENLLRKKKNEISKQTLKKKIILKKINNKRLNMLSDIISSYLVWHSIKIEQLTRAIYSFKPVFDTLAKDFNLSYEQLINLAPEEVISEKINLNEVNSRMVESGMVIKSGKGRVITGKVLLNAKETIKENIESSQKISGVVVFKGLVTARAAVCLSANELSKVKGKHVLITPMTTTDMTSRLKNVAAIVTDEGGLTCHAAIIAREFNIPCIVGTKYASRIFKNG
ncbi:hypothetical protein C4569_00610, partial [Candidatus Parcubacteria bacterium]